jgi:hypothetical protein
MSLKTNERRLFMVIKELIIIIILKQAFILQIKMNDSNSSMLLGFQTKSHAASGEFILVLLLHFHKVFFNLLYDTLVTIKKLK